MLLIHHYYPCFSFIIATVSLFNDSLCVRISWKRTTKTQNFLREAEAEYFTNTWAVRIVGGVNKAKKIANHLGYNFQKKISEGLPDIYLFCNKTYPEKPNYSDVLATQQLNEHPKIYWAEQQVAEAKVTRQYAGRARKITESVLSWENAVEAVSCPDMMNLKNGETRVLNLNDKYWPKQYYIKDCRPSYDKQSHDINLAPVWVKHRFFGKNIKVIVVDDGMDTKHEDLADNYGSADLHPTATYPTARILSGNFHKRLCFVNAPQVSSQYQSFRKGSDITPFGGGWMVHPKNINKDPALGLDLQDQDSLPNPVRYLWRTFSHGTRCAGIVGMRGNNTICGVGVAPSVTLGAVRLLGPLPVTDYKISQALSFKHTDVHIMLNSWGPRDNGKTMPHMGPLTRASLKLGIKKGREGLGLIYVFAIGNGKKKGDNCGCDAMVSSIYTIAVASCDHSGQETDFSERCASIMVTTYSSKQGGLYNVIAPDVGKSKCTTEHFGTSASASMVSGAIALTLEANPKLSWRDIQHLLAWTSEVIPLNHNFPNTWTKNGAGFYVSHDFGFGMLNINNLIEKAKSFQSIGAMNSCITRVPLNLNGEQFQEQIEVEVTTSGCENTPSEVKYLEHVQLTASLGFTRRGDLQITLMSPSGTKARLLERRSSDSYPCGIRNWTFDSVMTWGESPKGTWKILIVAKSQNGASAHSKNSVKKIRAFYKKVKYCPYCYPPAYSTPVDAQLVGDLSDLLLTFHGTSGTQIPDHYNSGPRTYKHVK